MASTAILSIKIISDATKAARELQGLDRVERTRWVGTRHGVNLRSSTGSG